MTDRCSVDPLVTALEGNGKAGLSWWWKLSVLLALLLAGASLLVGVLLFERINSERAANIARACQETNQRYDTTVNRLDAGYRKALKGASADRRNQIRESRQFTIGLIQGLVPRRDCGDLTRGQVG